MRSRRDTDDAIRRRLNQAVITCILIRGDDRGTFPQSSRREFRRHRRGPLARRGDLHREHLVRCHFLTGAG
jgi:hypothetical protein